ncbi:efflux RND transporter periplasmic adaptor subunit [candidate division WOR-3 bacterium]|nr:efflux RND transporter periplasmic adaptor subunit [candidate division WOR-3 bacterium]
MRKVLIILIIVVVIIAAVMIRIGTSKKDVQTEQGEKIIPVEVVPASKGTVRSTCEVLGTIKANKTAQVFPETSGRVTRIFVKEGSYVYKNSNLMAIRNESIGFEYEEGYIKSPISGNVGKILVDVGSMIKPQTSVALIVEYSKVKVEFNLSEVRGGAISKSQKVDIEIDALPGQLFEGKVSEISPVIDPMTRTISAKAVINNPKKILRPGMTARITINLGEKDNVIAIPKHALLDSYLFVTADSTAERRDVVVGLIGDENVEILQGLSQGEPVIVIGQERLAGGEKVNPIPRSK